MDFSPIWFSCSFCKKAFQSKSALIGHRRQVHSKQMEARKKRQLCYEDKDSSASSDEKDDDEDGDKDDEDGPNIPMGQFLNEESTAVSRISKEGHNDHDHDDEVDKRRKGFENGVTSSVTFWTESSTTEIIYLSDDDQNYYDRLDPMMMEQKAVDCQVDNDCEIIEEDKQEIEDKEINDTFDYFVENSKDSAFLEMDETFNENSHLQSSSESQQMKTVECSPLNDQSEDNDKMKLINQISALESPMKENLNVVTEIQSQEIEKICVPNSEPEKQPLDTTNNFEFDKEENEKSDEVKRNPRKSRPIRTVAQFLKIRPIGEEGGRRRKSKPTKTSNRRRRGQKLDKKFPCLSCPKSFVWQKSLTLHQRTVHQAKQNSQNPLDDPKSLTPEDQNLTQTDTNEHEARIKSPVQVTKERHSPSLVQLLSQPPQNELMLNVEDEIEEDEVDVEELQTVFCQICNENFLSTDRLAEHLQVCEVNRNLAMIALQMQIQQQLSYWTLGATAPIPWALFPPTLPLLPEITDVQQQDSYKFVQEEKKEEERGKPFSCKMCDRTFSKKWGLSAHEKVHTRPHTCTICSRSFAKGYNLKMHYQWHAKGAKDRVCKCSYCPQLYGDTGSLFRHQKMHAQDGSLPVPTNKSEPSKVDGKVMTDDERGFGDKMAAAVVDPTIYKCPKCPKFFFKEVAFTEHLRGHNNASQYESSPQKSMEASHSSKEFGDGHSPTRLTGSFVWENDNFRLKL